jgi:L,D-transpeptidase catalytic domain/Bacterial SH3 domain
VQPGPALKHRVAHARRTNHRLLRTALGVLLPSTWLVLAACVAPVAAAEGAAAAPVRYVDATDGLNLRAVPGGDVRDTLPDQAAVTLLAPAIDQGGEAWYPVTVAATGEEGWLASRYLTDTAPVRPARTIEVYLQGAGRATIDALEDGRVVRSMPAYAGAATALTPTGTFAVQARVESLTTTMWAAKSGHEWRLPYFLQVDGDVGIHGPKVNLSTGLPVPGPSSGCLSPSLEDSVWLFGWAAPGTPVHISRG